MCKRIALVLLGGILLGASITWSKEPEFKVLGRVSGAVVFSNESTNEIWVDATRGFGAGRCGILPPKVKATMDYGDYTVTIPDKGLVRWCFVEGEKHQSLRTNEVDTSSLPRGKTKGSLQLTFTTNRTWTATIKP